MLLGALRRPALQASLAGLFVGLIVAVGQWHFPVRLALNAVACGTAFALWPVMWIVFNALPLYQHVDHLHSSDRTLTYRKLPGSSLTGHYSEPQLVTVPRSAVERI